MPPFATRSLTWRPMTPFSHWFRSLTTRRAPVDPESLQRRLEALEEAARRAPLGLQGVPLNQAGDLCLEAGDRERALHYYGRAIDSYLEDEQPEPARGVARKIIRVHPRAVRTLCTLTWLDLAAGHMADAHVHLREYVKAAEREARKEIAGEQILAMARVVSHTPFVQEAADALERLGLEAEATKVRRWAMAGGAPNRPEDPGRLADLCFRQAVGSRVFRSGEGAVG